MIARIPAVAALSGLLLVSLSAVRAESALVGLGVLEPGRKFGIARAGVPKHRVTGAVVAFGANGLTFVRTEMDRPGVSPTFSSLLWTGTGALTPLPLKVVRGISADGNVLVGDAGWWAACFSRSMPGRFVACPPMARWRWASA